MAKNNVRIKPIEIKLDKKRHLLLDLNAYCEVEEAYGSFQELYEKMQTMSPKALRAFLWAGLVHEDENLTEKDVGKLIGVGDFRFVADKLNEAIAVSLPEVVDESKNSKASPKSK